MSSIAAPTPPLQTIIPSYLYEQYSDDATLQAFVAGFNATAQGYLDWFNTTPLAVYASPAITGALLDWVGEGLYGVARPVFSTVSNQLVGGAVNSQPINTLAIDGSVSATSGGSVVANDDFYKRTLTWLTYVGDGRIFNLTILRKKIARFLFGVNGADVTLTQGEVVRIVVSGAHTLAISVPTSTAATYFQEAFAAGSLPIPFQLTATVTLY